MEFRSHTIFRNSGQPILKIAVDVACGGCYCLGPMSPVVVCFWSQSAVAVGRCWLLLLLLAVAGHCWAIISSSVANYIMPCSSLYLFKSCYY